MEWLFFIPRHVLVKLIRCQKKPYSFEIAAVSLYLDVAAGHVRTKRAYATQWGWTERKVRYNWDELVRTVRIWASAEGRVPDNPVITRINAEWGESSHSAPAGESSADPDAVSQGGGADRSGVNVGATSLQRRSNVAKSGENERKNGIHVGATSLQRHSNVADPIISNLIKSISPPISPPWTWGDFWEKFLEAWRPTSRRKRTLAGAMADIFASEWGDNVQQDGNRVLIQIDQLYAIQIDRSESAPVDNLPSVLLATDAQKGRLAVAGFAAAWGMGLKTKKTDLMTYQEALQWRDKHAPDKPFPGNLFTPIIEGEKVLWQRNF